MEIVEEDLLLTAEFEDMPSFHPGERRAIGIKRVRELRVCTALVEERSRIVVHLDDWYARCAVL